MKKSLSNKKDKQSASSPRSDRFLIDSSLLKIGPASKALGVSIDTLRRWEKSGKISTVRTPGGTRLYSLSELKKINPHSVKSIKLDQNKSLTTEELLKKTDVDIFDTPDWNLDQRVEDYIDPVSTFQHPASNFLTKFLLTLAVSSVAILVTSAVFISRSFLPKLQPTEADKSVAAVLAVSNAAKFLEINSETQINSSLFVKDTINNLVLEATPSAGTISLVAGGTTLDITKSAKLDQDVSTAASPTFTALNLGTVNLSASKDQVIFQSGGPTGTLTWTPTSARTITLPDATTTLIGTDTTNTLTNKSISGSSNTLTSIPNSALSNNKITVSAGTNLTGGGDISLGSSATLSLKDSISLSGTLTVTGASTLSSTLAVTGASTLSSTLAVTGAATFSSTVNSNTFTSTAVTLSGSNPVISASTSGTSISLNPGSGGSVLLSGGSSSVGCTVDNAGNFTCAGSVSGGGPGAGFWTRISSLIYPSTLTDNVYVPANLGVGTTNSSLKLAILGNVGIGVSFANSAAPANGLTVEGNVGVGTTSPLQALHVVGQCVAKGTRIRRRRKNSKGEWKEEEVPVEDIQPDNEILSLNDKTGEFEWHKVEKTLDKGIQTVYRLETEGGKRIETTSEHPYLVIDKPTTTHKIDTNILYHSSFDSIQRNARIFYTEVLEGENIIVPTLSNEKIYFSRQGWDHLVKEKKSRFETMARFFALPKIIPLLILAKDVRYEKSRTEPGTEFWILQGIIEGIWIKVIIRQTKEKPKHFYSVVWKGEENRNEVQNAIKKGTVSRLYPRRQAWETLTFSTSLWLKYSKFIKDLQGTKENTSMKSRKELLKSSAWKKVSQIKQGQLIAVRGNDGQVSFEEVISVKKTGRKHTYDLQIESTHNFVGNNIVAHNTYITGNVGLGVTTPGATLSINGNSTIGYSGVNIAGPSSGLAVSGNVGIGITTANSNLSVAGNVHIGSIYQGISAPANGLFVDGNLGIGATTSSNKLDVWGNERIAGTSTIDSTLTVAGVTTLSANNAALSFTGSTPSITSGSSVFGIFAGGNVGIGTTGNVYGGLTVKGKGTTTGITLQTYGSALGQGLTVLDNGNVGIGTTGPGAALSVASSNGMTIGSGYATSAAPSNGLAVSGNVGIGTTSPTSGIHIIGTTADNSGLITSQTTQGSGINAGIQMVGGASNANWVVGTNRGDLAGLADNLMFYKNSGTVGTKLVITNVGNVGINMGANNPGSTLSVNGNALIGYAGTQAAPSNGLAVSGNVGIGITTANSALTVNGGAAIGSGFNVTAPTNGLVVQGNVGIGFSSPNEMLQVASAPSAATSLANILGANGSQLSLTGNTASTYLTRLAIGMDTTNNFAYLQAGQNGSASNLSLEPFGGNIGIGTTNPTQKLYIDGGDNLGKQAFSVNSADSVIRLYRWSGVSDLYWSWYLATGTDLTGASFSIKGPASTGNTQVGSETVFDYLTVKPGGNVGIGTTGPGARLGIQGIGTSTGITLQTYAQDLTQGLTVLDSGNVGIGITSPLGKLIVMRGNVGIGTSAPQASLVVQGNIGIGYSGSNQSIPSNGLAVSGNVGIGITTANSNLSVAGNAHIGSLYQGVTAPANGLLVDGNVGIGFTSPGSNLDIYNPTSSTIDMLRIISDVTSAGNVKFRVDSTGAVFSDSGINMSTPADVAENYPILDQTIESGDLVTVSNIKSEIKNQYGEIQPYIEKSNIPYQNSLLGIISTKPGVKLSSSTDGKPVALAGRVPVKVSNENGSIKTGDYLTSSSTPGVAMKATRPGQVIGKALEEFNGDTGKILSFVNISFADPNNFLASLSLDSDGNLIIPKVKTSTIILDPSVATGSASLRASETSVAISTDPAYTSPAPILATNTNNYIDLGGKIASLEERIKELENVILTPPKADQNDKIEATSSATPSPGTSNPPPKLELTSVDSLLATSSAKLFKTFEASEATISAMLIAYSAQIQDNFKVLGNSSFAKTSIYGDLTVDGTLSIENGSEINVLTTLYLQKASLAESLDIFNGKVTIDKQGNIHSLGEIAGANIITNKLTISNQPIASSSASLTPTIGSGKILAGQTTTTINTSQVNQYSKIFVTARTKIGTQSLFVSSISAGSEFKVSLDHAIAEDAEFDWWIVETKEK